MSTPRLVHIVDDVPELADAWESGDLTMVLVLDGFLDAGNAAAHAAAHLVEQGGEGTVVATFDVDQLHDYRARRPAMSFVQDHYEGYDAPRLVVRLLRDHGDTPFLLMHGPEPDNRWEAFAAAVREVVERLHVTRVVSMGSVPMAVPHTRPIATTHIPLRDVPDAVTAAAIRQAAQVTRAGLQDWFGIAEPRIALCALNPHAGDGGRFGREDDDLLAPAARANRLAGPFPADTVFVRAMRGAFDAVIAPYHDVGMTAIKVASFGSAVNVTLGLPFVRTSPDHGTALDIAGRGVADAGSMGAAIRLAARIASGAAARVAPAGRRG